MTRTGNFKAFVIIAIAFTLFGCQATRKGLNFDTSAVITLSADQNVNPDMDGRSSPVVIRVFKLTDARQFEREDFLNLYENADLRLGNDLVDTIILKELVPGETREEIIPLTEDIMYLGFLAEYMQYQKASSIVVIPIREHNKNTIEIIAHHLALVDAKAPKPNKSSKSSYPTYQQTRDAVNDVNKEKEYWESVKNK